MQGPIADPPVPDTVHFLERWNYASGLIGHSMGQKAPAKGPLGELLGDTKKGAQVREER